MRFTTLTGKQVSRNVEKYRINWSLGSLSKFQKSVKNFLWPYWRYSICYEECPLPGTLLQVDLLNVSKKIAVECHGKQHENFNKHFHNNSRNKFLKGIQNDMIKQKYLENNGYVLVVIYEGEEKLLTRDWFYEKFGINL